MNQAHTKHRLGAWDGAKIGIVLTFAYALTFAVYAVIRSSVRIQGILQPDEWWGLTLGNAVTLTFGVIVFALVTAILSALIGALTIVVLKWLLALLKADQSPRKAVLIGVVASFACWLTVTLVLQIVSGGRISMAFPETYVFWVGLPGLVFICTCSVISWQFCH
jgi:hypothetical protein